MWRAICGSVRGTTHILNGKPNQDSIRSEIDRAGEYGILAVADGHGSDKCFRSDIGSRLAVRTAVEMLERIVKQSNGSNLSFIKDVIENKLPESILSIWRKRIEEDYLTARFSKLNKEKNIVSFGTDSMETETKLENMYLAYGSTLLATIATNEYAAGIQIGDGEILVVTEEGKVKSPIPKDERLFANDTTSLCSESAIADFRFFFERLSDRSPVLILLTTDGYVNSFKNESGFLKVGSDILEILREEGSEYVEENIENWLTEASKYGSGDDITLGMIYRVEIIESRE